MSFTSRLMGVIPPENFTVINPIMIKNVVIYLSAVGCVAAALAVNTSKPQQANPQFLVAGKVNHSKDIHVAQAAPSCSPTATPE
jgi:hypothetical protein